MQPEIVSDIGPWLEAQLHSWRFERVGDRNQERVTVTAFCVQIYSAPIIESGDSSVLERLCVASLEDWTDSEGLGIWAAEVQPYGLIGAAFVPRGDVAQALRPLACSIQSALSVDGSVACGFCELTSKYNISSLPGNALARLLFRVRFSVAAAMGVQAARVPFYRRLFYRSTAAAMSGRAARVPVFSVDPETFWATAEP
jgi:hypothetical protein